MAEQYTQAARPMRVDTVLGPDVVLLSAFNGIESLSMPFSFELELFSTKPDIVPADVLRSPVAFAVTLPDDEERFYHGVCNRFTQLGQIDDLTVYRMSVVPWLWLLSLSRQSVIYQNLSVLDIVEKVFKRNGHSDFEIRCTRNYTPREFCVQYRETDLSFVSRMLEEEGIFYYFEHTDDKHVMVLADHNESLDTCPGHDPVRFMTDRRFLDEDVVHELEHRHALHSGKYTLRDYFFETPKNKLEVTLAGNGAEEIYDYPGGYASRFDGEDIVRRRLEAEEIEGMTLHGRGNCRHFVAGHKFTLAEHFNANVNGEYVLIQVQHFAKAGGYRSWDADAALDYHNDFQAIPMAVPYRPPLVTPKPVVHGSQTAIVVGPPGEEVYVDKYGRVKVQFHWDREGKRDQDSSLFIRVASIMAGRRWGSIWIPRIGDEVIVAFEEGDPDKPLIIGCLYNADQMPPFDLPAAGVKVGFKTHSSKGGGGHNEISMDDTKGSELITIHAQHDMNTTIQNDETHTVVNGNRTVTVQSGTNTETIKGNNTVTVQAGDYKVNVTGAIEQSATKHINMTGSEGVNIVGYSNGIFVFGEGGTGTAINGVPEVSVHGDSAVRIDSPEVDVGSGTIKIHGSSIELEAGGNKITIGSGGITIQGGPVTVTGSPIKLN